MSVSGCRPSALFLTGFFADQEAVKSLRRLQSIGATRDEYIELMARHADPSIATVIREEFAVLPKVALSTLIDAWAMADAAGKPFEVLSLPPEEPVRFARNRLVRITIDVGEEAVRVALSHVPTRHAEWYAAAAVSAR